MSQRNVKRSIDDSGRYSGDKVMSQQMGGGSGSGSNRYDGSYVSFNSRQQGGGPSMNQRHRYDSEGSTGSGKQTNDPMRSLQMQFKVAAFVRLILLV